MQAEALEAGAVRLYQSGKETNELLLCMLSKAKCASKLLAAAFWPDRIAYGVVADGLRGKS